MDKTILVNQDNPIPLDYRASMELVGVEAAGLICENDWILEEYVAHIDGELGGCA